MLLGAASANSNTISDGTKNSTVLPEPVWVPMQVQKSSGATWIDHKRLLISTDKRDVRASVTNINNTFTFQLPQSGVSPTANPAQSMNKPAEKKPIDVRGLVGAGREGYAAGGLLLTGVRNLTAPQLEHVLQQSYLVQNQDVAHQISNQFVNSLQTKGAYDVFIAIRAGIITFFVIDKWKPEWPLSVKLTLAGVVVVCLAVFLYFGSTDKPSQNSKVPAAAQHN